MKQEFERFDMTLPPRRTKWFLRPLALMISLPDLIKHRSHLTKTGMEGIKPPYLLLCNHNAFLDFKVATKAIWPARANYVVAIDGFIGREKLLRDVGCICKRKFTSDPRLIRQLVRTVRNGDIAVVYPEARYSLCGTTAVLPRSLGRLCRLLGVPVVTQSGASEGGAYGAALIAGIGTGWYGTAEEAVAVLKTEQEILPDEANREAYGKAFRLYSMIYPALKDVFHS